MTICLNNKTHLGGFYFITILVTRENNTWEIQHQLIF
jgi:hypothetical protein